MEILRTCREMQARALALRAEGRRIGLVPTMGALHEGHLSLVRIARKQADVVVVSIFVNPAQFGPSEDFSRYPRDLDRDAGLCRKEGVDIVFHPDAADVYAPDHSAFVIDEKLSRGLCGASRPGHFRGVATVVMKLFNLTQPHVAVFGEKDAQQLRILRRMVRDLNAPVTVVSGPTVREPDGLAMSSRNSLLTTAERRDALCLRGALDVAVSMAAGGERNADKIKCAMKERVDRAATAKIDYIEIVDDESLESVGAIRGRVLVALAVKFSRTRLIDNTVLG
jgi:pantoate--beta-alanine ligase